MDKNFKNTYSGFEIAVIGMSGRFPGAKNIEEFWTNLKDGKESITFFSDDDLKKSGVAPELLENKNYVKAGSILENVEYFDASFFGYSPKEAEILNPQTRIFYECVHEALEDAGYVSDNFNGLIGVYAGASINQEWDALTIFSGKSSELGQMASTTLSNKDSLSTRISYKLNLKGPSISLRTACSTSLVAIHVAYRALLTNECNIALAGGVSIQNLKKKGYIYQEGLILSPDGHCRPFDSKANGSIFGDGAGVVVLKKLKNAIKDRDNIYAVIKGSSINNDGSRKVGFTAPSVEGQADVIISAQKMAGVDPGSISFIETHGTATNVGDTIEFEALKIAFNTGERKFCCLGFVKSNIGHLDAAAGVAGFIKTVLALKHKLIPPAIHFKTPHPEIDLENSPFYINRELKLWETDNYPLRAGVSSFGLGGTNAHVVLEESPVIEHDMIDGRKERTHRLILVSARKETVLERVTQNLIEYFQKNPGINLSDVAYTLQVGRTHFKYRKALICSTINDAVDALTIQDSVRVTNGIFEGENRPVIFMFSGLGSQYVNMGLELYQKEPVFRAEMDRCFEILKPLMNNDIKEILYPGSSSTASGTLTSTENPRPDINRPEFSQPIIFIFEYALANLLMKWGIKPQAMIGYSFGEYVAGCISGVFSLENALRLVVSRGRLIQTIPPGSMLSVPLPVAEVSPFLNSELSMAIDNGSSCIVAGSEEAILSFEKQMKEKKIICVRVPSSRAIHSKMMEPILKEFERVIAQFTLSKPKILFISNVTGTWIDVETVVKPAYWVNHLSHTVQFATGMKELVKEDKAVFIEIGPGQDMSALALRYIEKDSNQKIIHLVRHPNKNVSDVFFLLNKIGKLWLYGVKPDWFQFYGEEKRFCISLPTYPFERQRYWIDHDLSNMEIAFQSDVSQTKKRKNLFFVPSWKPSEQTTYPPNEVSSGANFCWLIFIDESSFTSQLVKQLISEGESVFCVKEGAEFRKIDDFNYIINPRIAQNYDILLQDLKANGLNFHTIVHLWSITNIGNQEMDFEYVTRAQGMGLDSLLYLVRAIGNHGWSEVNRIQIKVVTNNMHRLPGEEVICPEKSPVLAALKMIPQWYPNITCCSIDISMLTSGTRQEERLINLLVTEFKQQSSQPIIVYRGADRMIQSFEPMNFSSKEKIPSRLKKEGVYLIVGGFNSIAFEIAHFLAPLLTPKLIFIKDHSSLSSMDEEKNTSYIEENLAQLEKTAMAIRVITTDITDIEQLRQAISHGEADLCKIDGIIYCNEILPKENVMGENRIEIEKSIFNSLIKRIFVLDKIFNENCIDFYLIWSSLKTIETKMNNVYGIATLHFLNSYAQYKSSIDGRFVVSVPWDLDTKLMIGDVLSSILEHSFPQVVVSDFDPMNFDVIKDKSGGKKDEKINLPTTESKYSRSALSNEYAPPSNNIEKVLTGIWKKFLGIEQVGIDDDFFELGADSLVFITIASRIHKEMNEEIPVVEFFNRSNVRMLAEYIEKNSKSRIFKSIEAVEKKDYYILSPGQKRLYILQSMNISLINYNMPNIFILNGNVDIGKVKRVFKKITDRHESLRTSFHLIDGEPFQKIYEDMEIIIEYYQVEPGGKEEEIKNKVEEIIRSFIRPFNLSQLPLMRVGLIKVENEKYFLLVDMHHIITDGTCQIILIKEFVSIYNGEELLPLRIQYKDYSEWLHLWIQGEFFGLQEKFWLQEFSEEIPVLNIPTDYPRPAVQNFDGNTVGFELSSKEKKALNELTRAGHVTIFMVLLAVYNILLLKLSNQEDIVVGTPITGRRHANLEKMIGMFANTLAIRNYPSGEKTFASFLNEIRERTLKIFDNQDYQFENLVEKLLLERDMSRNPLFDVMFVFQNMSESTGIPDEKIEGIKIEPYKREKQTVKFDLTLYAFEIGENLFFSFEYCNKLFREDTILRYIQYFKKIILSVIKYPKKKISEIEIISEEEKKRILNDFNKTETDYPKDRTIHQLFEEQVEITPDHIAVIGPSILVIHETLLQITYKELNEQSNRLACVLQSKGVGTDTIVGIMVERSVEMIVGILGILKSSGAYLPIDPKYPKDRIIYMLNSSGAKLVVTNTDFEELPESRHPQLPDSHFSPSTSLAYIIYTSGSTGRPKGVMVEHGNLVNLVVGLSVDIYKRYSQNLKICLVSPYIFDASIKQIFVALLLGHTLNIVPEESRLDGKLLLHYLIDHNIDISDGTPSHLKLLIENMTEDLLPLSVKHFIIGGEALFRDIAEDFFNKFGGKTPGIINIYGPTECTVDTTFFELNHENIHLFKMNIPIGKPMSNCRVYIVDKFEQLQPFGVSGELLISGKGVGRGYVGKQELTSEKFAFNPFIEKNGINNSIMYRTGDLARWIPDGNIEFLGRIDHQVKIRGYRIELGEIENRLLMYEKLIDIVVLAKEDAGKDKYLTAYFVSDNELSESELRAYLLKNLPDYMIPSYFVQVDKIPLTPNGKIDRRLLPEPNLKISESYTAPEDEIEKKLVELWSEILSRNALHKSQLQGSIGVNDNFFELGGHSLKAIILVSMIHKEMGIRMELIWIFKNPTIRGIASLIKTIRSATEHLNEINTDEETVEVKL